jgi:Flp pilus assembly protein TadB
MGQFAELAFTSLVKEEQKKHGSRHLYERMERSSNAAIGSGRTRARSSSSTMGSIWRRLAKQDGHTSSFAAVRKAFFAYWTIRCGLAPARG